MRICMECKWSKRRWFGPLECHHPVLGKMKEEVNPITGKLEGGGYWNCGTNRMHSNEGCGYEGNLWEPKV